MNSYNFIKLDLTKLKAKRRVFLTVNSRLSGLFGAQETRPVGEGGD